MFYRETKSVKLNVNLFRSCAIKLAEIIHNIPDARIYGDADLEIENIEYDSRMMKPNSLFIAVTGYKTDGYNFIEDALSKGAVAVLGEKDKPDSVSNYIQVQDTRMAMAEVAAAFYNYPGLKLRAVGVTGTNGKTTTSWLIRNIFKHSSIRSGLISSLLYDTGKESFNAERTTPESLDLQRLLYLMIVNNCERVVLEVSSHALCLKRVEQVNFTTAVYTNITRDHLDFHETMENYLDAKKILAEKLEGSNSSVVVNLDVPEFKSIKANNGVRKITYSIDNDQADIYCSEYEIRPDGTTFNLNTPSGNRTVSIKLPGRFNLYNALAASGAALSSEIDIDSIVNGLESSTPVPGRFNYVDGNQPFAVYVDYAHTPDALERLCQSAREINKGKMYILFGCGGDRDKGKRPLMGKAATSISDFAILTSDNPRSEDPQDIINDVLKGMKSNNYEVIENREDAIRKIINMASPGDVVLLAGKGAENYQEIKGQRFPFSDTEIALDEIKKLNLTQTGKFGEK